MLCDNHVSWNTLTLTKAKKCIIHFVKIKTHVNVSPSSPDVDIFKPCNVFCRELLETF